MFRTLTPLAAVLASALTGIGALAAPVNVAHLYGSAAANEEYSSNVAANAIDNNNASMWIASGHGSSTDPNWLTIDLGMSYAVDAIDIYWQQPDGLFAGYTNDFSLFHGLNGSDWTLIGSGTFFDEDLNQISAQYGFVPGQSMRYVKFEVNGGSHWSGVAEIRVWAEGQSTPTPIAAPASLALLLAALPGLVWSRRGRARR